MEEQKHISNMGGTMRLGAYDCRLKPGSHAAAAYAPPTSESVTATAMNSTAPTAHASNRPDCHA